MEGILRTFRFRELILEPKIPDKVTTISSIFVIPLLKVKNYIQESIQVDPLNIGKRSIKISCRIYKKGKYFNIYFVNTHLPFGSGGDYKFSSRKEAFEKTLMLFILQC